MPMSLLVLANELLLLIAYFLGSERSINAFARTNRHLYLIVNDYLYRHNAIEGESSALLWAAKGGHSGSAAKSIAQGSNVNIQMSMNPKFTRFGYQASLHNEARCFHLLIRNNCLYYTPIYIASLSGHHKVVDLLIQSGADIDSVLGRWANPLQAAAESGQLLVVQKLIALGSAADKAAPYSGRTALHSACCEGNDVVVQHLIHAGANVMARDDELDTPLHLVLKDRTGSELSSGSLRSVQWLLISGADMYARNRDGQTPFSMALKMRSSDVGCLFKNGSSVAIYEGGSSQTRQPGWRSTSLQRLWAAYLDKQTQAATKATRLKRIQAEAVAREESAKRKLEIQQENARRRRADNQKQVEETARKEKEQRTKVLQEQEKAQRAIETSIAQKQVGLRRTWHDLRAKAESQSNNSVSEGATAGCKHAALIWNRRKGKVDCGKCHKTFVKCFFFQCPDCGTNVCQSCMKGSENPG